MDEQHRRGGPQDPPAERRGEEDGAEQVHGALGHQHRRVSEEAVLHAPDEGHGPHAEQQSGLHEGGSFSFSQPIGCAPDPCVESDPVADDGAEDQCDERGHGAGDLEHHVDADEEGEQTEGGEDGLAHAVRYPTAENQADRGAHRDRDDIVQGAQHAPQVTFDLR